MGNDKQPNTKCRTRCAPSPRSGVAGLFVDRGSPDTYTFPTGQQVCLNQKKAASRRMRDFAVRRGFRFLHNLIMAMHGVPRGMAGWPALQSKQLERLRILPVRSRQQMGRRQIPPPKLKTPKGQAARRSHIRATRWWQILTAAAKISRRQATATDNAIPD